MCVSAASSSPDSFCRRRSVVSDPGADVGSTLNNELKGNMEVGQCVILFYRAGKHSARHVEERFRAGKSLVSKMWVQALLEKQK